MKINFLNSVFFIFIFIFIFIFFLFACDASKQQTSISEEDAKLIAPFVDDQVNRLGIEDKKKLAIKLAAYQKQTKNQVRIIFTADFVPHRTMGQFLRAYARDKKFSTDSSFMLIGLAVDRGVPDVFPNWRMKQMISQKEIDDIMRIIVKDWANQELYKGLENSISYLNERGTILGETFLQMTTPFYSIEQAMQKPDSIFRLDLRHQKLTTFPKEILQFKNLNELWLSNNQLGEIPAEIAQLANLQSLDLSNNLLATIPESIKTLKNLKKINLTNNPQIDENQVLNLLTQLPKLQSLEMNFCKVSALPPTINLMKQLKDLQMTGNELKDLPNEIGDLANLEFLVVNRNRLTTLPDGVGKLQKLQLLYADSNQISQLPPQIGELRKLQVLRLHFNQLTVISPQLKGLTTLQDLTIDKNRLGAAEKETIKKLFPKIKIRE